MDCLKKKCLHKVERRDVDLCGMCGIPITYFTEPGICYKDMPNKDRKKIKTKFYTNPMAYRRVYGKEIQA